VISARVFRIVVPETATRGSSASVVASAAHPRPDRAEGQQETQAHQQQAAFGAHPHPVALRLVAQAQVLALDRVGVLALLARLDDPRERAERRARHGSCPRRSRRFRTELLDLPRIGSTTGAGGSSATMPNCSGTIGRSCSRSKLKSTSSRSRSGRLR
jgi:hypothetical protein